MTRSHHQPITQLLDLRYCQEWLVEQLHPQGFGCIHCGAEFAKARVFRQGKRTQINDYRCKCCFGVYNLYSGTIFAHKQLRPQQVVMLLHGVQNGVSIASIAGEIGVSWRTVSELYRRIAKNGGFRRETDNSPEKNQNGGDFDGGGDSTESSKVQTRRHASQNY